MKVKMLAATYWGGERLKPGDMTDIPEVVAERWVKAGVAEKQPSKTAKKTDADKE